MTFDTTVGGSASTSYVSTATASAYFETRAILPHQSAWSSVSSTVQQAYLIEATRRIDAFPFAGKKSATSQALQFPRDWFVSSTIPTRLANAVCEEAFALLNGGSQAKRDLQDGITSQSAGNINTTYGAKQCQLDSEQAWIYVKSYVKKGIK